MHEDQSELKKLVSPYLVMIHNKELQPVNIQDLTPNYPYLVYNIDTEFSGRSVYTNVNITVGYYNPNSKDEVIEDEDSEDEDNERSDEIPLSDVKVLEYSIKGSNPNPMNDINKFDVVREKEMNVPIYQNTEIYNLPLRSSDIKRIGIERLKIKEELEELHWVPIHIPNVSFIGKKYRKSKKAFEEKQAKYQKGGIHKKSRKYLGKRTKRYTKKTRRRT
jgi:hypothetical protein